jgi:hypothetical protein
MCGSRQEQSTTRLAYLQCTLGKASASSWFGRLRILEYTLSCSKNPDVVNDYGVHQILARQDTLSAPQRVRSTRNVVKHRITPSHSYTKAPPLVKPPSVCRSHASDLCPRAPRSGGLLLLLPLPRQLHLPASDADPPRLKRRAFGDAADGSRVRPSVARTVPRRRRSGRRGGTVLPRGHVTGRFRVVGLRGAVFATGGCSFWECRGLIWLGFGDGGYQEPCRKGGGGEGGGAFVAARRV